MYVCTYVCACVRAYVRAYVCMYVYIYIYIHIHIHIHIDTYTHTYIHTYKPTNQQTNKQIIQNIWFYIRRYSKIMWETPILLNLWYFTRAADNIKLDPSVRNVFSLPWNQKAACTLGKYFSTSIFDWKCWVKYRHRLLQHVFSSFSVWTLPQIGAPLCLDTPNIDCHHDPLVTVNPIFVSWLFG